MKRTVKRIRRMMFVTPSGKEIFVAEALVKSVYKHIETGDFAQFKTIVDEDKVIFEFKTNYSEGQLTLHALEV
jgi:hypothetical protein